MYSCILHGWSSHDGMCPTCAALSTTTVASTTINQIESPSSEANVLVEIEKAKIKMLEEMKDWAAGSMDNGATGDEILYSHNDFFSDMDTWIKRCEEKIAQYNAASPQTPIPIEPEGEYEWVSAKQLDRQEDKIELLGKCLNMLRYLYMNEYCGEHGNEVRELIMTKPREIRK